MIYIHIPFCKSFCAYCDFYSCTKLSLIQQYISAVLKEWDMREDAFGKMLKSQEIKRECHTLYLGGGTPSLLSPNHIHALVERFYTTSWVKEALQNGGLAEITMEANPGDLTPDYCNSIAQAGVNRLSIGIQSMCDNTLRLMGRRHNAKEAVSAVTNARRAGIKNISVDLIFGFEQLSLQEWKDTLTKTIELNPDHISAYQLSIEPDTPWGRLYAKGELDYPPESVAAEQYSYLQNFLKENGYEQYEISNFAKPGYHSRHNSAYWRGVPYMGLGAAAHSYTIDERSWNIDDIEQYIAAINSGRLPFASEKLSANNKIDEAVMLGLRCVSGIDLQAFEATFDKDARQSLLKRARREISLGNLVTSNDRLYIPASKLFVSDSIIRNLML